MYVRKCEGHIIHRARCTVQRRRAARAQKSAATLFAEPQSAKHSEVLSGEDDTRRRSVRRGAALRIGKTRRLRKQRGTMTLLSGRLWLSRFGAIVRRMNEARTAYSYGPRR